MDIYDVTFPGERPISVMAKSKKEAADLAIQRVRTNLKDATWTRIPSITKRELKVGDTMPYMERW